MRMIIAGTRTFNDYEMLREKVGKLLRYENIEDVEIITGGASGADALAKTFARRNMIPYKEFPANWALFGKSAGPIRNEQMAKYAKGDEGCLVCFWDGKSRGTANMIKWAEKYRLRVEVYRYGD